MRLVFSLHFSGFQNDSFCIRKRPFLLAKMNHFGRQNGPFCDVKWAISKKGKKNLHVLTDSFNKTPVFVFVEWKKMSTCFFGMKYWQSPCEFSSVAPVSPEVTTCFLTLRLLVLRWCWGEQARSLPLFPTFRRPLLLPLPFPVGADFQIPVNGNAQRFLATLLNKIFTLNQTKKLCLLLAYSDFSSLDACVDCISKNFK